MELCPQTKAVILSELSLGEGLQYNAGDPPVTHI